MRLSICQGCGAATPNRPAFCDECNTKRPKDLREAGQYYDRHHRDPRSKAFYRSTPWLKVRAAYLASIGYLCEDCVKEHERGLRPREDISVATEVHHVVPIAEDWSRRLEWANLQGLCPFHHMGKRSKSERGRVVRKVGGPLP